MSDTSHVVMDDVTLHRGSRCILEGVSLRIPRGKVTLLMGPSGGGKTSLLRLMTGQLKPTSGRVHFNDVCVHEVDEAALYHDVRMKMGVLFQQNALFQDRTVYDNVAFLLKEHTHLSPEMERDLVCLKLQAVGLRGTEQLMPSELSGGMARRVALARAVMLDPELMLYDEPLTGQDPISMGVLKNLIKRLNEVCGMTSVLVSHQLQQCKSLADHCIIMAAGRVVADGPTEAVFQSKDPKIQQFLKGSPDGPVPFHYPAACSMTEQLEIEA